MSLSLRPLSSLARAVLFQKNTVALPTGYLFGLTLSPPGSTSLPIAAGSCRDSTDADNMVLSAITKTTGAWAAGSGNGGLDTGSIAASTWYHAYAIKTVAGLGGTTDALISLSATSPTMPTGYSLKRRIGSVQTDGSKNLLTFVQLGDEFIWSATVGDVSAATNPGTSAVLRALSVPTGIQVNALFRASVVNSDATICYALFTALDATDEVPAATSGNASISGVNSSSPNNNELGTLNVRTNTSSQIRSRLSYSSANVKLSIATFGWIDTRGRLY